MSKPTTPSSQSNTSHTQAPEQRKVFDKRLFEEHDPDLLQKLGATPLNDRRWTLGNSRSIVKGARPEPFWVSVAWIVVPLLAGALFVGWLAAG